MEKQVFLILAFPEEKTKAALLALALPLVQELHAACGEAPQSMKSDESVVMLFAKGEFARIEAAVQEALPSHIRYLVLHIGRPYVATGLSAIHSWLRAHC